MVRFSFSFTLVLITGCPSDRPINSVKARKEQNTKGTKLLKIPERYIGIALQVCIQDSLRRVVMWKWRRLSDDVGGKGRRKILN